MPCFWTVCVQAYFWKIAEFSFPFYQRIAYSGVVYQWCLVLFFSTSQWFGTIEQFCAIMYVSLRSKQRLDVSCSIRLFSKEPSKISDRTWKRRADFFKFVFIGSRMRVGWHSPFKTRKDILATFTQFKTHIGGAAGGAGGLTFWCQKTLLQMYLTFPVTLATS